MPHHRGMVHSQTYHTRFSLRRTLTKSVDTRELSVRSILTYPGEDLAGDIVAPSGLNFRDHIADPWIDLEHGNHPDVGRSPVAWARKSLSRPGGEYAVQWGDFDIEGKTYRLPVGTSYFDPHDRLSAQVFALCEQDCLPGVSLEFRPVPGYCKSLGRSPLEPRDAFHFYRADVVRWTHCVSPVNPNALTVTKSRSGLQQVPGNLGKILSDGRINGEQLHSVIRKALAIYTPTRRVSVTVEKAMDELETPDTAYDDTDMGTEGDTGEGVANNGVAALYALSQGIEDLVAQARENIQNSDNPAIIKDMNRCLDDAESSAEKIKGLADKHDAKIQDAIGKQEPEPEEPEDDEGGETAYDEEPEDVDMEKDDEGTYKAIRGPYKPILKAMKRHRFTLRQALAGIKKAEEADNDPKYQAEFVRHMARARKYQRN